MFKKVQSVQARMVVGAMLLAASMGTALAQESTPEASIGEAVTKVLLIVAAGGAALITISLAKVGWNVGAKWISRIGGRG